VKISADYASITYEMWKTDFYSTMTTSGSVTASNVPFFALAGTY